MEAAARTTNYAGNSTITYSTGLVFDTKTGERPAPTPRELVATRAVEAKDGWLGQILMSGEIVYETRPQKTSQKALGKVNTRIHNAFRRLITGL